LAGIEHLQMINIPASKVYKVLTTTEGLAEVWTDELSVGDEIGSVSVFRFGKDDTTKMRIDDLVPNKRIVWHCIEADPEWIDTVVSFEIEEIDSQTYVTLKHIDWREITPFYRFCNYNWGIFLYSLKMYCEEGRGLPYQKRKF
jgi:uncharacterized protein YndB with AHSA1/START domain